MTDFVPLKTAITWTDPTANTDGSAIDASEITGYSIGVREDGSGAAGTYPLTVTVQGATAVSESAQALITALSLKPGNYWAAVQTVGPTNSDWSTEAPFSIPAPLPVPAPPTNPIVS